MADKTGSGRPKAKTATAPVAKSSAAPAVKSPAVPAVTLPKIKQQSLDQSAKREAAFLNSVKQEMDKVGADLYPAFTELYNLGRRANESGIMYYFTLGRYIRTITAKYQRNGIVLLTKHLKHSVDMMTRGARMFDVFGTEEVLMQFLELRMKNGRPLSLDHFVQLTRIGNTQDRLQLAQQTIANDWTSDQLSDAISGRFGGGRKGSGTGRKFVKPSSFSDCMSLFNKSTEDWLKRKDNVWNEFSELSDAIERKDATPELYGDILTARENAVTLARAAQEEADRLGAVASRVEAMLESEEPAPPPKRAPGRRRAVKS